MNEEKDTSVDNRTSEIRFLNGFTSAKTDFDRNLADFSNKSGHSGQRILCVEAVRRPYWQNTTVSKSVNSKKKSFFCFFLFFLIIS